MERDVGLEPTSSAWKAELVPDGPAILVETLRVELRTTILQGSSAARRYPLNWCLVHGIEPATCPLQEGCSTI